MLREKGERLINFNGQTIILLSGKVLAHDYILLYATKQNDSKNISIYYSMII